MQGLRLATRVSTGTACERCRRQKQRCDPIRPCSNCVNAKQKCVVSGASRPPAKRARTSSNQPLPAQNDLQLDSAYDIESQDLRQRGNSGHATFSPDLSSPRRSEHSRREESMVAEFGNSESAMDVTRRVLQSNRIPEDRATFAIPGGDFYVRRNSVRGYYSVLDLVGVELPPKAVADALLDVYFYTVHWFSLVVFEPSFRQRYQTIISNRVAQSADRPFLFLLLMVLVMGCHYGRGLLHDELQEIDLDELRVRYLKPVRNNFMDLLEEDNLEFVQICVLLGSYWLYWGKPRSSFILLGTAIKSAQALSLHRQTRERHSQGRTVNVEERKRVWWTIYTWDRFATVVYGRPLGINDRDCDVAMPAVFTEHLVDIQSLEEDSVELSPYQTNLNCVYRIASPMLENIYRIRYSNDTTRFEMAQTVKQIDETMRLWCSELPRSLDFDQCPDLNSRSSLKEKVHQLQALSLRLTYLNLTIIIHRPILADWRLQRKGMLQADVPHLNSSSGADQQAYERSFERCLSAALAISRIGQSKPNLISLVGRTHLLSFLAMNIFTSSVVLFICASSNILSNAAQESKRGMSRNLKILKSLPNAGSLSKQCSTIVGDLINIVLDTEKEEMLLGPLEAVESAQLHHDHLITFPLEVSRNGESRRPSAFQTMAIGTQPTEVPESSAAGTEGLFGRTMGQLHQVLKDASHSRHQQRADTSAYQQDPSDLNKAVQELEPSLSNTESWQAGQLVGTDPFGRPYEPDMTQLWLWDFEQSSELMPDWSIAGHDT